MSTSLRTAIMGMIVSTICSLPVHADSAPALTPDSVHIQRCSACHYVEGKSPGPEFPNIAGQYESYLSKAVKLFRENKRESEAMQLIASLHKEQELVILANYYAKLKPAEEPALAAPDQTLRQRGQHLYMTERVYGISCADCHGADGRGYVRKSPRSRAVRATPRLAGQQPAYLMAVMQGYAEGRVTSGMCAMRKASKTLSQTDIQSLVEYLSSK